MSGPWASSCSTCECFSLALTLRWNEREIRISARYPYVVTDERRLLEVIRAEKLRYDGEPFLRLSPEGSSHEGTFLSYKSLFR